MKKAFFFTIGLIAILSLLLPACSQAVETPPATSQTVTDLMGHQVTIPSPQNIQKVAILTSPPNVITFILGVNDKMVATSNAIKNSTFLNHIYPGLKDIPAVRQSAGKVNIEALLQADPQICLGSDIDLQVVEKATSIPCLRCIDDAGSNDYPGEQKKEVRFFGKVFGKEAQAEKYCKYLDDNVAAVEKAVGSLSDSQKLKVYLGFNADHLTTFGAGSFMDAWITAGGCINAAHPVSSIGGSEGGLVAISMEQVLSWNPDILIIDTGTPEDVYKDTKWATVPAVKNKRVYVLPRGMFGWNRASTEPAALFPMWLGITAYPDKFPGKTVNDELKRFYGEIINYQLTDADISLILTGK